MMTQRLTRVIRYVQISGPMDAGALRAVEASPGGYLEGGMPSSCGDSMREFPASEARREWWAQWLASPRPSLRALAQAALLLTVPVSEAPCERAGSLIERIFDKQRCRCHDDILEAEIIVRADQVHRKDGSR
jgi:hypothetical protein